MNTSKFCLHNDKSSYMEDLEITGKFKTTNNTEKKNLEITALKIPKEHMTPTKNTPVKNYSSLNDYQSNSEPIRFIDKTKSLQKKILLNNFLLKKNQDLNFLTKKDRLNFFSSLSSDRNSKFSSSHENHLSFKKKDDYLLNCLEKEKFSDLKSKNFSKKEQMNEKSEKKATSSEMLNLISNSETGSSPLDNTSEESNKTSFSSEKNKRIKYDDSSEKKMKRRSISTDYNDFDIASLSRIEYETPLHSKINENKKSHTEFPKNTQNKRTALEYLVEEAYAEQRKMMQIAKYENKRRKMEQKKEYQMLKSEEKYLNDEIEKIEKIESNHKDTRIIFQTIIENNEKFYICADADCNKKFPSLSRVRRHYIVHTGAKPYKCLNSECRKTFSRKDNMLQHYRNHCYLSRKSNV